MPPDTVAAERVPLVRRLTPWLIAIVVGILVGVCGWFRLPPGVRGTMWAEDTRIFLAQRLRYGVWHMLFQPYGGYLHLGPRVLTDVAVSVSDLGRYGETVTVLALVVVGAVASATYAFSGGLLRTRTARVVLAFVPVLLPVVAVEVLGDLANLHSFGLFLLPLLLLSVPRTTFRLVAQCVVTAAVVLTEVQSVFFLPLLVLLVRRPRSRPVAAVYLAGLAAQFVAVASSSRASEGQHVGVVDTVVGFLAEPVLAIWWPDSRVAAARLATHGPLLLVAAAVPFVVALGVALAARWDRRSLLAVVFAAGAVVVWSGGVLLNGPGGLDLTEHGLGLIGTDGYLRYAAVPGMFLLAGVVVAADRLLAPGDAVRWWAVSRRVLGGVLVVALLALLVVRFPPPPNTRPAVPTWSSSVSAAVSWCHGRKPTTIAFISGAPAGWGISVECRYVRAGRPMSDVPVR